MTDLTTSTGSRPEAPLQTAPQDGRQRLVTWDDPAVTAAGAAGRTGVEFLQAMADGEVPMPPIARLLGIGIETIEPGRVVFTLDTGEHQYNPIGSIHGGVFCTVLDSAMGCAVHAALPAGRAYTTLELKVSFMRPLTTAVAQVKAVGEVLTSGRRVATAEGRLVGDDGTLYAHATTTCLVWDLPIG